jgi:hypothetical protein
MQERHQLICVHSNFVNCFRFLIVYNTYMCMVIMQQYKKHIKFILAQHKMTLNWTRCVVVWIVYCS